MQVRDLLHKACCDGTLLKELQVVGTCCQAPETPATAIAPESPAVAMPEVLALDDLASTVQKALSVASRDGRLLKALQEMDPAAPSTTSLADVRQADAPGGYDLGALRMNLTNDFVQASKDGRLETAFAEMLSEGRKPQAPSKDVHCNAASAVWSDAGA